MNLPSSVRKAELSDFEGLNILMGSLRYGIHESETPKRKSVFE